MQLVVIPKLMMTSYENKCDLFDDDGLISLPMVWLSGLFRTRREPSLEIHPRFYFVGDYEKMQPQGAVIQTVFLEMAVCHRHFTRKGQFERYQVTLLLCNNLSMRGFPFLLRHKIHVKFCVT